MSATWARSSRNCPKDARPWGSRRLMKTASCNLYRDARLQVQQSVIRTPRDEALLPSLRRFDADPAFRTELLNRFLSPALRARSAALSQELQARRAVLRANQTAVGGQGARPTSSTPTKPPVAIGPDGEPIPTAEQIFWNWVQTIAWLSPLILLFIYVRWRSRFQKGETQRNSRVEIARLGTSVDARTAKIEDMFNRKIETLSFDLKGKGLGGFAVSGEIIRSLAAMAQRDRVMLRAVYHLFNADKIDANNFYHGRLALIYGDGKGHRPPRTAPACDSEAVVGTLEHQHQLRVRVCRNGRSWVRNHRNLRPNSPCHRPGAGERG
jgi:hypothetical protein